MRICSHVARRSDGPTGQLGCEPAANVVYALLEKTSILHELGAQHSAFGSRQAEGEPLRQATLDFGRHRGKTYEWVRVHDRQYCEWAVLAVVEDGATASPQLKFTTHVGQSLGTSPRVTSSPRRKLHSQKMKLEPDEELADFVKRLEHLQAMVRQRKTTAKSSATSRR